MNPDDQNQPPVNPSPNDQNTYSPEAQPQPAAPTTTDQPIAPNTPKLTSFAIAGKTTPYFLLRAGVSFLIAIAFILYAAICAALVTVLAKTFNGGAIPGVVGFIFFIGAFGIWRFLKSYVLYMVKAGHVAVVSELVAKGSIETGQGQIAYGTAMVKKYFLTANAMWVLDNLVRHAVYEIQRGINTIGELLSFIPGMGLITGVADMFVGLLLNYTDESIFAYIFQKSKGNVWKSSADGLVLYAQNWKAMIKAAGILALSLIGLLVATGALGLGIFAGATALHLNSILIIGIVIAIFLLLKWAILDPFVMIFMVNRYLNVALYQEPSVDLYEKVQKISKRFRKIIDKSQENVQASVPNPANEQPAPQPTNETPASPVSATPINSQQQPFDSSVPENPVGNQEQK